MENIDSVKHLLRPGDFMATIDLKDAYFSVPIDLRDRKYLRFLWDNALYEFTCLPFGYSLVPRVFTKILKPVQSALRSRGIRVVFYLDDILIFGTTYDECLRNVQEVYELLFNLGFTINNAKSQMQPVRVLIFLGFIINSKDMLISLPTEKVHKIISQCQWLLNKSSPTVCEVAQVSGLLVSSFRAVKYMKLFYRSVEMCESSAVSAGASYEMPVSLTHQARLDLEWITNNNTSYNGVPILTSVPTMLIECDASSRTLESTHVQIRIDNTAAVYYINNMGGTKSITLNKLAREIWYWCISRDLDLTVVHIPGLMNTKADFNSRSFNVRTEWSLHPTVFSWLIQTLFTPDIDLFASRLNAKLQKFVSWMPDPCAYACDAFSLNWSEFESYAFHPFSLISRVLSCVRRDKVPRLMLIAPVWPTQSWYPILLEMLIDRPILLPKWPNLLKQPHNDQLHPLRLQLQLAAWIISGEVSLVKEFHLGLPMSSVTRGHVGQQNNMNRPGMPGVAGVIQDRLIYFKLL